MIKVYIKNKHKEKKGKGYKDINTKPIQSYAGSDRLLKRLMILLASANAGNNSNELSTEYTAILDELLFRNKIDSFMYKVLLKKLQSKLGIYKSKKSKV